MLNPALKLKNNNNNCRMVDIVIHVKSELELTANKPCNTE